MAETKGLPYGCDYAKTSRSSCKDSECKGEIEQHELRMSVRTKSNFFEGLQDNWFHFGCFWKRARQGITEASIRGFEHLKWDDQERIRERIARKDGRIIRY
jgi:poly [ADP-ribose] polymerase